MRNVLIALSAVIALASAVALGPLPFRRDVLRYRWAGAFGTEILDQPIGIAYRNGRLFVTDATRNRIVVFDTAGSVVSVWDHVGLERPMHLSVGDDGLLYVAEYLADRVTVVDSAGNVVTRAGGHSGAGAEELDAPGGVAAMRGAVFVADFYNHRMQVFADEAPNSVGVPGRVLAGRLHYPTDVAVGDSFVVVADAYNHRVQVFRPNGDYVRRWGGPLGLGVPGPFRGWFRVATGVHVAGGRVYVADFDNDRVQVFTERGAYRGALRDSLERPTDVTVTEDGTVFVVDFGHRRVVRYEAVRQAD